MADMIKALVELDRQARKTVEEARKRGEEDKTKIAVEKKELYDSYLEKAHARIERMKADEAAENERRLAEIEEGWRASAKALEEQFQAGRERWVDEIVRRCIQP